MTLEKKKAKPITLKNAGDSRKSLTDLADTLISGLGEGFYQIRDKQSLLYSILKQISPVNKKLQNTSDSIDNACQTVLKHFRLPIKVTVTRFTDKGVEHEPEVKKSFTDHFCQIIVDIDKLPYHEYQLLLSKVNKDLYSISELIKWYENQQCIQKYIRDDDVPKNHEERIIFDFYRRCIKEREEIFNYQLFGIKERVRNKCRHSIKALAGLFAISEMFRDRPYFYAQPYSIHFFDCRRLDVVGHRVMHYSIDKVDKMEKLYQRNKSKFYREYFKRFPVSQHFDNFRSYLPSLPLSKDREVIFKELVLSFKGRKWINFYALALPQVEGLFSEMCEIVLPERDLSQKSLTHKVNLVRPFHAFSTSYFDYYQYFIPLQRNKFAHTGYDEDFKLKSYDLLVDLVHLLTIFNELDNPLVKIKKIHTRMDANDFLTLREVATYLDLLNMLKSAQFEKYKEKICAFEKEFLSQECGLDYTCYEVIRNLPGKVSDFISSIDKYRKKADEAIDFYKMNKPQIEALLKSESAFKTWKFIFISLEDHVHTLQDHYLLLYGHSKHLPSLRGDIKKDLDELKYKYGKVLKLISDTNSAITKK